MPLPDCCLLWVAIMHACSLSGQAVRTDLLDLRTWRWRSGALLQRQQLGGGDDDGCLLNMGVVAHEGQVLAVGGRHYWKVRQRGLHCCLHIWAGFWR